MKRPICIATIASIIGIIMGLYLKGIAPFIYCILGISSLVLLFLFCTKMLQKNRLLLYAVGVFLIFLCLFFLYSCHLENTYQKIYQAYHLQELEIEGYIIGSPEEKEYQYVYQIKLTKINQKKIKPVKFLLQVKKESNIKTLQTDKQSKVPFLEYGDKVHFIASYQKPKVARNTMGFDYSSYLKIKGVSGIVSSKSNEITILEKANKFSIGKMIENLKINIKENLNKLLSKDLARIGSWTYHWRKTRN